MRPPRQPIILAGAAIGLFAALIFFATTTPPAAPSGATGGAGPFANFPQQGSSGTAGSSAPKAIVSTDATMSPSAFSTPPLDDLKARSEALAKSARTLRDRYRITDPDPENTKAKVTIDRSPTAVASLDFQKVYNAQLRDATITLTSDGTRLAASTGQTLTTALDSSSHTTTLTFTSASGNGTASLDQKAGLNFIIDNSASNTGTLTMTGKGTLTLLATQPSPEEMRATEKALRHPDEAIAEYLQAKADYLAAKEQYQAASLVPLPPDRIKDWRRGK